ncbi:MAG: GTPase [Crenarchaeota archaeon]|nr:GTPase [Thermoproteota archaeon]
MFTVFFVGTAGSGKTSLVHAFGEWLEKEGYDVALVNLDPAVDYLPYIADVDVRDIVSARKIAKKYKLGPNASIIAAVDTIIVNADKIREIIFSLGATYVLIDTPGQMEIFAFRGSGPLLISRLSAERSAIVFVIDSVYARSPSGFVSSMLLSLSSQFKFNKPQVNVLNKIDLVDKETIEQIVTWSEEPEELLNALSMELQNIGGKLELMLTEKITEVITALGTVSRLIPVSAKTGEGLEDLYRVLHQIYIGGQDYDYVE